MGGQGFAGDFHQAKIAIRQVKPGQASALPVDGQGNQQAVAFIVQQPGIGQCARRHHAVDRALHGSLAFGVIRVTNLLANGNGNALLD